MGRKLALVIGNSDYADPRLARLKTPEADVRALADLLRAPEVGGFDAVQALLNRPFAEVQPAIEDLFADSRSDDLVLLYFSGHGVKDDRGQLYLALAETRSQKPRALSISSSFLKDVMDGADVRQQVLILDCCYSDAFAAGMKGAPGASALSANTFVDETRSRGRVVLTASDTTQYAWEGDQVLGAAAENSLYTHYLIEALRTGAADEDGDGWVTPNDLHAYISRRVAPRQHPRLFALAQEGAIRLAHNPHPPTATLPPELLSVIENPLAGIRAGAVEELTSLLRGRDTGLAQAAHEALEKLAKDDSRRVSEAAVQALENQGEARRKKEETAAPKAAEPKVASSKADRSNASPQPRPRGPSPASPQASKTLLQRITASTPPQPSAPAAEAGGIQAVAQPHQEAQAVLDDEGWVTIPAGEFLYGEKKEKRTLPVFQIRRMPVTNAEYARFVKATDHAAPDHWPNGRMPPELAQHPVVCVSWDDAQAYCKWAQCRLPTEEEWEKAARGTDGREYPWGNEPPDAQRCNFDGNVGKTTPMGQYSPQGDSPYGCVDMAGNVWEWTASRYDNKRYVLRGGSWSSVAQGVRAALRRRYAPVVRYNSNGFRCSR